LANAAGTTCALLVKKDQGRRCWIGSQVADGFHRIAERLLVLGHAANTLGLSKPCDPRLPAGTDSKRHGGGDVLFAEKMKAQFAFVGPKDELHFGINPFPHP
jgi:hypothetical protein